ncbi:MAG TPA: hypothetical protein VK551_07215 [Thermodesulfobacteriota bacterium]|nr:hypothetical protein [Thermodesulfobacteriota bacterium]
MEDKGFTLHPLLLLGDCVATKRGGKRGEAVGWAALPGSGLSEDKRDASQRFGAATFNRLDSGLPGI